MSLESSRESTVNQLDIGKEQLAKTTPYSRNPEEIRSMLHDIVDSQSYLYIDKSTNPAIDDMSIYRIDSRDRHADIGRTLEAQVFNKDAGYEPEFIEEKFSPYDKNSIFFVLVENEPSEDPQSIGVLRTIDCNRGSSETISMFKEFYGEETPLPLELSMKNSGEKVWDIFTVVVDPRYRDGTNSAWLYHALYKMSVEEGIDRWISNITPKEIRNLRHYLGIPFIDVPGVDPVFDIMPNGSRSDYGFYYADVKDVGPAVAERIEYLKSSLEDDKVSEKEKRMNALLSQIASVALKGSLLDTAQE